MAGNGERKLVEREARRQVDGEEARVRLRLTARGEVGGDNICAWSAKLFDAAAVATSIGGYGASRALRFEETLENTSNKEEQREK